MKSKATILHKAEFNPAIKTYLLIYGSLILLATIVGILLIPVWLILGPIFIRKYFDRLECELTSRSLRFQKGLIIQTERTIPLDKIQDLTFKEGPLLKAFGLSILKVETAGNTGKGSSDLTLIGILEASVFRNKVFDQRDAVTDRGPGTLPDGSGGETVAILKEIRDSLRSIEGKVGG